VMAVALREAPLLPIQRRPEAGCFTYFAFFGGKTMGRGFRYFRARKGGHKPEAPAEGLRWRFRAWGEVLRRRGNNGAAHAARRRNGAQAAVLGLHLQQLARLGVPRRRETVLAGSDARQRHQLPPAEGRPRRRELLGDGAVILLGVQG